MSSGIGAGWRCAEQLAKSCQCHLAALQGRCSRFQAPRSCFLRAASYHAAEMARSRSLSLLAPWIAALPAASIILRTTLWLCAAHKRLGSPGRHAHWMPAPNLAMIHQGGMITQTLSIRRLCCKWTIRREKNLRTQARSRRSRSCPQCLFIMSAGRVSHVTSMAEWSSLHAKSGNKAVRASCKHPGIASGPAGFVADGFESGCL